MKEALLYHLRSFRLLLLLGLAIPHPAQATGAMAGETIAMIAAALPQCSGGWTELGERGRIGPTDLTSRLSLLSRPSDELEERAGRDLYQIAKGLLAPSTGVPDWISDGDPYLKCSAQPVEAVALLKYLAGEGADTWRGNTNIFQWLGLAYEAGVVAPPDNIKAQRYYLRYRMHAGFLKVDNWSDGVDVDLIRNVERAGLRPYLDALAQSSRGGGAVRLALAEAALPTDPAEARKLLLYLDDRSLTRLLELEAEKLVPVVNDVAAITVWADATRTLFGYRKYAARLLDAVRDANGGPIPTLSQRPSIAMLASHLDRDRVSASDATLDPIPVRALVKPDGRAIYIEACQVGPPQSLPISNFNRQLDAARLYNAHDIGKMPKLLIAEIVGRTAYSWVILPAVHFQRASDGRQEIHFIDLPADQCVHSAIADAPAPPPAP